MDKSISVRRLSKSRIARILPEYAMNVSNAPTPVPATNIPNAVNGAIISVINLRYFIA